MSEPPAPLPPEPEQIAAEPPVAPEPTVPPQPEPERYPFWTYHDLLLFAGLTIPCLFLGQGLVRLVFWALRVHPTLRAAELLPEQLLGYGLLFWMLRLIFRMEYDRPFWASLAWTKTRLPWLWIAMAGVVTAYTVAAASSLFQMPATSNPLMDLMKDRASLILMAIFGVVMAPVCEELIFRGFLQPLLVRSLGVAAGILVAAIPFGLLHYKEYGDSWRHAALISLAGALFGWMRHATGSTMASSIMHAAYNSLGFLALFMQRKG